jgi:hypothetical protein
VAAIAAVDGGPWPALVERSRLLLQRSRPPRIDGALAPPAREPLRLVELPLVVHHSASLADAVGRPTVTAYGFEPTPGTLERLSTDNRERFWQKERQMDQCGFYFRHCELRLKA